MKAPPLIPVAVQGDPCASRTEYVMPLPTPTSALVALAEPAPIFPAHAHVTLGEYVVITDAGGLRWRFPKVILIVEHGKPTRRFELDVTMKVETLDGEKR